jgi:hypothetical protein
MAENWNPYYRIDISDEEFEKRQEQFCGPATCCIRAGLDMAVAVSGGVLGFTAGDLRKMYPEGVPDWVTGGKDHKWSYGIKWPFENVWFRVSCSNWPTDKMNGTFAEMSNEAQLVL